MTARIFLALLLGCTSTAAAAPDGPRVTVHVGGERVIAELAADPASRRRGLMHRPSLPEGRGMLFVWPRSAPRAFWMKDTPVPLSVAFLDHDGYIRNIHRMAPDNAERRYRSRGPARFALEVPRGWFRRHGIRPGDRCRFRVPGRLLPSGESVRTGDGGLH
jgi:hypothetical protein